MLLVGLSVWSPLCGPRALLLTLNDWATIKIVKKDQLIW